MQSKINSKLSDILEDDDGLFDDDGYLRQDDSGNLIFNIDYDVDLRGLL